MVLKTIDRALELGISPVKLNCVVIKNLNDIEVLDFVEMTRDKPIEVRFIEFMPFDGTTRTITNIRESMGFCKNSFCKRSTRQDSRATSENRTPPCPSRRNVTNLPHPWNARRESGFHIQYDGSFLWNVQSATDNGGW
jgi:molybdenum cofactor biosynthesis enzyme MoaA